MLRHTKTFFDLGVLTLVLQENHCNYTFAAVDIPKGCFEMGILGCVRYGPSCSIFPKQERSSPPTVPLLKGLHLEKNPLR